MTSVLCLCLNTFKACSGEMLDSDRSSCSTQRLSWESSSNTPSMFSTSQANQTYKHADNNLSGLGTSLMWSRVLARTVWCWGDPYLRTQGLALYKRGRGISSNPANQRGEQTPISMVTQGILHEVWKWKNNWQLLLVLIQWFSLPGVFLMETFYWWLTLGTLIYTFTDQFYQQH